MRNLLLLFCFSALIAACSQNKINTISIKALPIDATVSGDILDGPSVLNDPNRFVWGGSVVEGDDGKYHMLYATWECGDSVPPFEDSWVLNSKIAYAVSDYPDRGFVTQKIILQGRSLDGDSLAWDAQMVHNPHLRQFNDKFYLYYIGSIDPGVQAPGSKGENLNKRNRVQQNQKIGVIEFDSFEALMNGDFERPDAPILSPRTRVKPDNIVLPSSEGTSPKPDNIIVVNPSVVQRPSDGKFLLFFKGNFYDPDWRGIHGVALSDSPTGPFTPTDNFAFEVRTEDGKIASGEDPYVWFHPNHNKFYVVLKDFTGKITKNKPGLAILESADGINWQTPSESFFMKKELILKTGETIEMNRLERPQLLIGADGNPRVLYTACTIVDVNQRQDGTSFNVQIPLASIKE